MGCVSRRIPAALDCSMVRQLRLASGQAGGEVTNPPLHCRPVPQAQVSCFHLPSPAPDSLVGVEVRAVTRRRLPRINGIHQPQVQGGPAKATTRRSMSPRQLSGHPSRRRPCSPPEDSHPAMSPNESNASTWSGLFGAATWSSSRLRRR